MSDQYNSPMDQNEFMKRMKAIASDLWGGVMPVATTEAPAAAEPAQPKPAVKETEKPGTEIKNLWKTADESIDWTDALSHSTPADGLTSLKMWSFYHKHAEKVSTSQIFHSFKLKKHACKRIWENHFFCKFQIKLSVMNITVWNTQKHIGIKILLVCKKTIGFVTAIFKIRFIFGIAGRVPAVSAANQNNCKTIFGRDSYNSFVPVNQTLLSRRKFCSKLAGRTHFHKCIVCPAKTNHNRLAKNTFFYWFSTESLPWYILNLNIAINKRFIWIVLEVSAFNVHLIFLCAWIAM